MNSVYGKIKKLDCHSRENGNLDIVIVVVKLTLGSRVSSNSSGMRFSLSTRLQRYAQHFGQGPGEGQGRGRTNIIKNNQSKKPALGGCVILFAPALRIRGGVSGRRR